MNTNQTQKPETKKTSKQDVPVQLSLPFGEEWFQEVKPTPVLVEDENDGDRN